MKPSSIDRPMQLRLEPAAPSDDEFLFKLYSSTRRGEVERWGWDARQIEGFLRMQMIAQRHGYEAAYPQAERLMIKVDGTSAGRFIVDRSASHVTLVDISLLPEFQNRGVGTRLISNLMAECQSTSRSLKLHVARGNRAIRLYERLGFSLMSEDAMYLQMEWHGPGSVQTTPEQQI
jgi:ribosomal protein S18 acetylase RimI-like enzyme